MKLTMDQFEQVEERNSGSELEVEDDEENNLEEEEDDEKISRQRHAEMEELEKEYQNLRSEEQMFLKTLRRHKDEDAIKGQAIKNQKALWDKSLEFRFLLQKAFSSSNKLPQEPVRSNFCNSDTAVDQAYLELISSCQQTLNSLLELQEALLENNQSITYGNDNKFCEDDGLSSDLNGDHDEEWSKLFKSHLRIASFRNNSVDKWHRKTQVTTGAAAFKGRLLAFNQSVSDQVNGYMRDPSRMFKQMQLRSSVVGVFGKVLTQPENTKEEVLCDFFSSLMHKFFNICSKMTSFNSKADNLIYSALAYLYKDGSLDADPELLDDSEFYQQLLKEFLETCDPTSSGSAFFALRKLQPKKRKMVDRRASKSRKIRYNVHEKIVNFMAPVTMNLPPMAPKLFENLFGMGNQKSAPVS